MKGVFYPPPKEVPTWIFLTTPSQVGGCYPGPAGEKNLGLDKLEWLILLFPFHVLLTHKFCELKTLRVGRKLASGLEPPKPVDPTPKKGRALLTTQPSPPHSSKTKPPWVGNCLSSTMVTNTCQKASARGIHPWGAGHGAQKLKRRNTCQKEGTAEGWGDLVHQRGRRVFLTGIQTRQGGLV